MFDDIIALKKYTEIQPSFNAFYRFYSKFARKTIMKKIKKKILGNKLNYNILYEFILFYHNTIIRMPVNENGSYTCEFIDHTLEGEDLAFEFHIVDCRSDRSSEGSINSIILRSIRKYHDYGFTYKIYFELKDGCCCNAIYNCTSDTSLVEHSEDSDKILNIMNYKLTNIIYDYIEKYMYS